MVKRNVLKHMLQELRDTKNLTQIHWVIGEVDTIIKRDSFAMRHMNNNFDMFMMLCVPFADLKS